MTRLYAVLTVLAALALPAAPAAAAQAHTARPSAVLAKPAPPTVPLRIVCEHRKTGREMPLTARRSPQVRCYVTHRPIASGR